MTVPDWKCADQAPKALTQPKWAVLTVHFYADGPSAPNWTATREGYLGRVPKALILDAVREGAGTSAAARLAGTKKKVMAADAAALLDGTGWLPAVLHVPGVTYPVDSSGTGNQDQDAAPVAMAAE